MVSDGANGSSLLSLYAGTSNIYASAITFSPCGCQHRGGHGFEQQQHIPSMPPVESYDQHQIAMQQAHYARQAPYPPNYAMPPNEHAYPNPPGYDHNLGFNKPGDESE